VHYGLQPWLHADRGANFESKVIRELCQMTGMAKSRTTPYHAMGNGLMERMNRTLLDMLGRNPRLAIDAVLGFPDKNIFC